jgi:tetratricopeptide (TPR) repeat protein
MNEEGRVGILKSFVEKNRDDPFSHYGLAMEYARLERTDEAIETYSRLLETHPDYVPAYYQAGMLFAKVGDRDQALRVLRKGAETADRLGNVHARNELQEALASVLSRK